MAIPKLLQHWPCMAVFKSACFTCLRIQNRLRLHQTCRRYLLKEMTYGTVIPCKGHHSLTLYLPLVTSECSIHLYGKTENIPLKDKNIDEKSFLDQLCCLNSTKQILQLLDTAEHLSDRLAAEALLKIAEVESKHGDLFSHSELVKNQTFQAILVQFEQECQRLSTSSLVTALKALVQLGMNIRSASLSCFLHECQERVVNGQMTIENLCVLGECLPSVGSDSTMLDSIMNRVQAKKVESWTSEEIVRVYSLLQALSANGLQYQSLLDQMHTVAILARLSPKQISSVLYSLAKLKQTGAIGLIRNLRERSVKYVPHFTDEELSNVLVAFNEFSYSNPSFTEALEMRVSETAFTMSPEAVTQVMQYCNRNRILSKPIFNAVAESFVYNLENFTTYQITAQVTPFGKLNYLPPNASELFRCLERVMSNRMSQFQPQTLLNLVHSCTLIQRFPVNFFEQVFSPYFIQQLQDQNGNLDPCVAFQLAQLYLTVTLECPFYKGPKLFPKYRLKLFSRSGRAVETEVNRVMYRKVTKGLIGLLGAKLYFASQVLSPHGYTLDIEIGLDEDGFVLPHYILKKSSKRIVLCIDNEKRFCSNSNNLLGKECIKQRHLKLLGYNVVQIPYYELNTLHNTGELVEYLHKKIFPHSYRMKW